MTKYASINPATAGGDDKKSFDSSEFAALVNVKSSRYTKHEYNPDSNLAPKIGIKWAMGTTKGNTFERTWSIGVPWDGNETAISEDGKQCSVPIRKNSDAFYLLQKIVAGGFPADRLTDDVSVFEGETFFMATDANPKVSGATRKIYPKAYHPEGWDAALAETLRRRAEREAENAGADSSATLQSSYTPPTSVQQTPDEVLQTAGDALIAILQDNGSRVERSKIPALLNGYIESAQKQTGRVWDRSFRQSVAVALWDMSQLTAVVNNNPALKIDGETISLK